MRCSSNAVMIGVASADDTAYEMLRALVAQQHAALYIQHFDPTAATTFLSAEQRIHHHSIRFFHARLHA